MKNILVVTGGAGFVGSNLINLLIKKTNYRIVSIDDYSSGSKKNHIKNCSIGTIPHWYLLLDFDYSPNSELA